MSKTRTVLVIGVGSIGERHLRCFQSTGRARLSLCEINPALREKIAAKYGIDRAYADLDAAMEDPPEAAVVATPAHLHIPMATRLARAGVHLLIEKPLSTSLDGIDTLGEIVRDKGLVADVAYVMHAHPALRAMKAAIDSGRFGPPVQVVVQCGQHFPTYRPAYREIYYKDRATGGGAIQDAMTHILNTAEWMVGPIDRLVADAAHQVLEGVDVEDTVHVLARHGNVLGSYSLNQYQAANDWTLTVVCLGGTVRFEGPKMRWRWMTKPEEPWHDEPIEPFERDAMFVTQAQAFLDAVEGKAEPWSTLDEGLQTLRCNLAVLASADGASGWQRVGR
ncbi:MAG: Gfo/Idh/MocA family oxidoreductase [Planctomycetia bacterium]|nr:Gfo/Idh/MocA family oxidoreductase [Planctomycetia bacterium]